MPKPIVAYPGSIPKMRMVLLLQFTFFVSIANFTGLRNRKKDARKSERPFPVI